jgi:hypothetical protein
MMNELKTRVAQRDYTVDPHLVAEAFLASVQNRCWYPLSTRTAAPADQAKPGSPSMMRPTGTSPTDGIG